MKLIVDIPDREYKILKAHTGPLAWADHVLKNGTPLPKGHGRLIDADAFLEENKDYTGWILCSDAWGGENAYKDTLEDLINEAPTIIEADRSEEK